MGGDQSADEKEYSGEDRGEESDWPSAGNDSGASGVSFTGDNESSMEGVDIKLEEEEESECW